MTNTLISDVINLKYEILVKSSDCLEKGLFRTQSRLFSLGVSVLIPLIASPCKSLALSTMFFADAAIDEVKLSKIKAKLIHLDSIRLDKKSTDYDQEKEALEFQKNVYSKILDQTQTAKMTKIVTAISCVSWALVFMPHPLNPLPVIPGFVIIPGVIVGLNSALGTLQNYTEAAEKNKLLADQFILKTS